MEEEIIEEVKDHKTDRRWEKWWWSDFNEFCKTCKKNCKQSHKVIVTCPKYEKIE